MRAQSGMKFCPTCKTLKLCNEFGKSSRTIDGYYGLCKECKKESRKKQNKEHIRIKEKQYRLSLPGRYKRVKREAKERNIIWAITLEDFKLLTSETCHYCEGSLPTMGAGLDRKDNKKGYLTNNVVPCCTLCNRIRSDIFTMEQMIEISPWLIKCRLERERQQKGNK